jgi:hypothetical protein
VEGYQTLDEQNISVLTKIIRLISVGYSFERAVTELYLGGETSLEMIIDKIVKGDHLDNKLYNVISRIGEAGTSSYEAFRYLEELMKERYALEEMKVVKRVYQWRSKILMILLPIIMAILTGIFPRLLNMLSSVYFGTNIIPLIPSIASYISLVISTYYFSIVFSHPPIKSIIRATVLFFMIYVISVQYVTKIIVGI